MQNQKPKCVLCKGTKSRHKLTPYRPCCHKCEKIAPSAMSSPGCFMDLDSVAGGFAKEVMKEFRGTPALDAGILAAAQAVEHYEIARYGTLKTWATELGLKQSVKLLEATLAEEKKTDDLLTNLAESEVNQHARAA